MFVWVWLRNAYVQVDGEVNVLFVCACGRKAVGICAQETKHWADIVCVKIWMCVRVCAHDVSRLYALVCMCMHVCVHIVLHTQCAPLEHMEALFMCVIYTLPVIDAPLMLTTSCGEWQVYVCIYVCMYACHMCIQILVFKLKQFMALSLRYECFQSTRKESDRELLCVCMLFVRCICTHSHTLICAYWLRMHM